MRKDSNLKVAAKLIVLIKPLILHMCFAILAGVIGFLCAITIPILGGFAILNGLGLYSVSIPTLLTALILLAVFRGFLRYAEQAGNHYIAFKLLARIRDQVFGALRKLAPAKLEGKQKGNLIALITSDIELLEVFYAHTISPVAIALVVSTVLVIFIGSFHWALGLIALGAYLTVGVLLPILTSRWGRGLGEEYRKSFGKLTGTFLDCLRGMSEILQYGVGQKKLEEVKNSTTKLEEKQKELKAIEGRTAAVTSALVWVFSIGMLAASIVLYNRELVGFDAVLISTIAMISSFGPVIALSNLANNLLLTFAAARRVLGLLEEQPVVEEVSGQDEVCFTGITCKELNFSYGEQQILKDIELKIPKGSLIGISGKSGSGKSTLLRLLMRFWDRDSGELLFGKSDIKDINTNGLRQMESYMTQETDLFADTLENNVRIGKLHATVEEVQEACKKASIHEFIMGLPKGYGTPVGELGETLSGGEKQRIGLARAFLHDSPLLLLDEPTSNLDSLNEGIILRSIEEAKGDKTVVLVSHRASTMAVADQVFAMKEGRGS